MRWLVAAGLLLAAPALAQRPRSRTLVAPESAAPAFVQLVRVAASQLLGDRLPQLSDAAPLAPALLVVARADGVAIWDVPAVPLSAGRFARATVASCPGPCAPALRDAVAAGLVDHHQTLTAQAPDLLVLVLADAELPHGTLPIVLRSIAVATRGAPPAIGLVVRTPRGLGQIPVLAPPPSAITVPSAGRPLLLEVDVDAAGSYVVRNAMSYGPTPPALRNAAALDAHVGHLKSRDPDRQVVFVSAAEATPLRQVVRAIGVVRPHYPVVVVKLRGPLPVRVR